MSTAINPYEPPQEDPWHAGVPRPVGRIYDDYPVVVFETVITEVWFLQGLKQGNRLVLSNPFQRENIARWIAIGFWVLVCLGVLALCLREPESIPVVVGLAAVVAVVFVGFTAYKWRQHSLAMMHFRQNPLFNTTLKVSLYREGLAMEGIITTMTKKWRGFLLAGRFPDGLSLIDDKNQRHWLPFADLVRGSAVDAEELLRQSVTNFKAINKV
jgi:hypothetical protein